MSRAKCARSLRDIACNETDICFQVSEVSSVVPLLRKLKEAVRKTNELTTFARGCSALVLSSEQRMEREDEELVVTKRAPGGLSMSVDNADVSDEPSAPDSPSTARWVDVIGQSARQDEGLHQITSRVLNDSAAAERKSVLRTLRIWRERM